VGGGGGVTWLGKRERRFLGMECPEMIILCNIST